MKLKTEISIKLCIYMNFRTVLFKFLETGTSDLTFMGRDQELNWIAFSLYPLSFFPYSPLNHQKNEKNNEKKYIFKMYSNSGTNKRFCKPTLPITFLTNRPYLPPPPLLPQLGWLARKNLINYRYWTRRTADVEPCATVLRYNTKLVVY